MGFYEQQKSMCHLQEIYPFRRLFMWSFRKFHLKVSVKRITRYCIFLTLARKAGVIVIPCPVQMVAAAGLKFVVVTQPKSMHEFSPNFWDMFIRTGSRAE